MSMLLTAAPAAEPVTFADAKAHLRVVGTTEDDFITSLIVTSKAADRGCARPRSRKPTLAMDAR